MLTTETVEKGIVKKVFSRHTFFCLFSLEDRFSNPLGGCSTTSYI
jgi:hypothetical protein